MSEQNSFTKQINDKRVNFSFDKTTDEWNIYLDHNDVIYECKTNFSPYLKTSEYDICDKYKYIFCSMCLTNIKKKFNFEIKR